LLGEIAGKKPVPSGILRHDEKSEEKKMLKYLCKRIVISIATVFVLVTVVFFLVRLMPGGPFVDAKMTPEIKATMNAYYGLDKPLAVQYFNYLGNLLHGNLGYSMRYTNRTVNQMLAESFPYSFDLGLRALLFAFCFGLTLGIVAAINRGKKLDFLCIVIAIIGTSIPDFILGGVLQYIFGIKLQILPVAGYTGFRYTILPAIGLGLGTLASVSRVMRSSMLEVVNQDYIKTAKSKGLSKLRIVTAHEIRNAILPVVTLMGPTVAAVLTGTFVIESIFAIPGMGKYYVESIENLDYTVVLGTTVFYGVFLVLANTVVDILYGFIDPRIRIAKEG
jgi:ABC-type dipeptide/oligopeptide/nickel transport systems, permease components